LYERIAWSSSERTPGGRSPSRPSADRSSAVNAVPRLKRGSLSRAGPRGSDLALIEFLVVIFRTFYVMRNNADFLLPGLRTRA
jgi:hypothetical protein